MSEEETGIQERWDYHLLRADWSSDKRRGWYVKDSVPLLEALAEAGRDGWEVVSVVQGDVNVNCIFLFLKRRVIPALGR